MKLKKILETLDGLDDSLHGLYEKSADGKFHLQVEDDDGEALRRAKEHEKGLRQIAERDLTAAREELAAATGKVKELEGTLNKDTTAIRADHERAMAALREEHAKEKAALEGTIRKIYVNDVANRIGTEIGLDEGAAELLADNITRRLTVEIVNGEPVTRVLAVDGSPSVASPDDLKKEYLQNPKYAGILRASNASGGGATGGGKGGGATKKLSELGDAERAEWYKRDPDGFNRAVAAEASTR